MPYRVPEGPVDPFEPFPLEEPSGGWTPAPIVRGRDLGRPASAGEPTAVSFNAGDAQFVDIVEDAPVRLPADALLTFDEPLEAPHEGDGAADLGRIAAFGLGGDGSRAWTVVDGSAAAPPPLGGRDPWAVVDHPPATPAPEPPPAAQVESGPPPPPLRESPFLDYEPVPRVAPAAHGPDGLSVRSVKGPPLSSRAILIIGCLTLACLVLAAALAFQAISSDSVPPSLDAPDAAGPALPAATSAVRDRANWTSSLPVSDTTLTAIERAAIGPLEGELGRLGRALQSAFGLSSAEVAPVLRPYIAHAGERIALQPGRFRLVVQAPDVELAVTRADAIMRAFQTAGAPADKLTMTASAGPPAVRFER